MLPRPVSGSRTWTWTIEAPALAAPIAASAICLGVTGIAGCLPIGPPPVTAQVMIVFAMMEPPAREPNQTQARTKAPCSRGHGLEREGRAREDRGHASRDTN